MWCAAAAALSSFTVMVEFDDNDDVSRRSLLPYTGIAAFVAGGSRCASARQKQPYYDIQK